MERQKNQLTSKRAAYILVLTALLIGGVVLFRHSPAPQRLLPLSIAGPTLPPETPMTPTQVNLVAGAEAQIGDLYDASYCTLLYPNGDPPTGRGACTDVVIRSLRAGGHDLQSEVHEDMRRHWDRYPHKWGLARPDPNIDHRRVPNLAVFFAHNGQTLPVEVSAKTLPTWQPGDIVTWKLPGGADHIGLVSGRRNLQGIPLVIHNMSRTAEQDVLTLWPIAGHYRYPKN